MSQRTRSTVERGKQSRGNNIGNSLENQRLRQRVAQLEAQLLVQTKHDQVVPARLEDSSQFHEFLNKVAIAILVVDRTGQIVLANPKMEAMFGYHAEDLIGYSLAKLLPERMRQSHERYLARFFEEPRDRPMGRGLDLIAQHRDGTEFPVEISLSVMEHEGATQVVAFIVDITGRKQAEQQRLMLSQERERVETIKQVVAQIGHDFRTPLASMMTSIYLLKHSPQSYPQDHLSTLEHEIERLTNLIEAMVRMTRLDALEELALQPVDVNDLMTMVVTSRLKIIEKNEQTIVTMLDENLPPIAADQDELAIALEQVVENALHFTPQAGKITISTWQEDHYVVIQVQDTGIGIDQADITHIFDRFYRADQARETVHGLNGLGLSMVQRIVELHAGRIEVESQQHQGSTFRLYLPQAT